MKNTKHTYHGAVYMYKVGCNLMVLKVKMNCARLKQR